MRIFFKAIIAQLLINAYVFWRGWQILPNRKYIRIPYILFFVVELLIYLLGFLASDHLPAPVLYHVAWIGSSWMIFIIYVAILLFGYDLLRFINKRKRIFRRKIDLESRRLRQIYFCSIVVFVLCVMVVGHYNFRHPKVTELTLHVEKKTPLLKDLRIVVVSDVHAGFLIDKDILSMYVDRIMEQKPDLVLMPGDIIDYDLKSVTVQNLQEEFLRIKAPYGVYGSTGNHEYIRLDEEKEYAKISWLEEKSGITMLRDTAVMIDSAFYLVGREDDKLKDRKHLSQIMSGVDKNYPIIVINHEPHRLNEEVEAGADIALYGHTHDGQIFPWNYAMKMVYEVSYGYKKKGNTHVYVSSGLGLAGPQYRIGTISEIVVLNVKFDKE